MNSLSRAPRGFAALVSTLVISTSLLVLALSASSNALMARMASLESTYHAEARLRAYACAQVAFFELAADASYRPSATGDTTELAPGYACRIDAIIENPGQLIVDTSGTYRGFSYHLRHALAPATSDTPPFTILRVARR